MYPSMPLANYRSHDQQFISTLLLSLSWCRDSIQVTPNVLWDKSCGHVFHTFCYHLRSVKVAYMGCLIKNDMEFNGKHGFVDPMRK